MDTQTTGIYLTLLASLVFLTLLLTLFIISVLRNMRRRLNEYKKQIGREIELIDRERERISADLHDELGSGLASVGLLLNQVAEHYGDPKLEKAGKHIRKQQQKIKEISYDLAPPILESRGLHFALTDLVEEIRSHGNFIVISNLQLNDQFLLPAKSVHIYRIIREILTNTMKHANASQIHVHCEQDEKYVRLELSDNGDGFDTRQLQKPARGFGLQHIQSRIGLLNATMSLESITGKGTSYNIQIPMHSILIVNGK